MFFYSISLNLMVVAVARGNDTFQLSPISSNPEQIYD